ncbi:MAG: alpha/beta hydrolase [Anaerolineae bacterium]|nr:alpha/beta hydrolase [Anaerolineae bacterium]
MNDAGNGWKTPWFLDDYLSGIPTLPGLFQLERQRFKLFEKTIHYGWHPQQLAVVCWPCDAADRRDSVVYFLHGGGWRSGSPVLMRFIAYFFAGLGYPTIMGGYRLAPHMQYPVQVADSIAALGAGLRLLDANDMSGQRIILSGQSAGAQLAALLAYGKVRIAQQARQDFNFQAYLGISGPLNFAHCNNPAIHGMIDQFTGNEQAFDEADPYQNLDGSERIPALLIHGELDQLVHPANSITFAERLRQGGCPAQVLIVPGRHHANLVGLFWHAFPETQQMVDWLAQYDAPDGAAIADGMTAKSDSGSAA